MRPNCVGILGGRSLVGSHLINQLNAKKYELLLFSRQASSHLGSEWQKLSAETKPRPSGKIELWISLLPIWILCDYLPLLQSFGVKRLIVLSSTSLFSKQNSANSAERDLALLLADSESKIARWAALHHVMLTVLRPTLIYGGANDKNISVLFRFVKTFCFFPFFGSANGLRQPIHAADVADACGLALESETVNNKSYNISGAEVLSYQEMVRRIFVMLEKQPRFIFFPRLIFLIAIHALKIFPRFKKWTPAMVDRMNSDLVFDHLDAAKDFGFAPRPFILDPRDFKS